MAPTKPHSTIPQKSPHASISTTTNSSSTANLKTKTMASTSIPRPEIDPHQELAQETPISRSNPFLPAFEHFRAELDEYHDRRERVVKASRDVTAASKKIIFALQRIQTLPAPLPTHILKSIHPSQTTIATNLRTMASDLRGVNAYRYARSISPGLQEWVEAMLFWGYLERGRLVGWGELRGVLGDIVAGGGMVDEMGVVEAEKKGEDEGSGGSGLGEGDATGLELTPEDYILGLFDATGELMRFAITAMATTGSLPSLSPSTSTSTTFTIQPDPQSQPPSSPTVSQPADPPKKEHQETATKQPTSEADRTILTDLRALRHALTRLDVAANSPYSWTRKAEVTAQSVEKVERALYGLVVRGAERPRGWMPELEVGVREEGA